MREELRRAGLRDHADEDADFGVTAAHDLEKNGFGRTPTTAPGITTLRTTDLVALLAQSKPLVIDTIDSGHSIPVRGSRSDLMDTGVGDDVFGVAFLGVLLACPRQEVAGAKREKHPRIRRNSLLLGLWLLAFKRPHSRPLSSADAPVEVSSDS